MGGVNAARPEPPRRAAPAVPPVAERGAWFVVGVPWAAAMVVARGPAEGWLLLPPLVLGVLAREPVMWSLWALRRRLPPPVPWGPGLWFGLAAAASVLVWGASGVGAAAVASAAAAAVLGAVEVLTRVLRSRPTPLGGIAGAVGGGAVTLAVLSGAGSPTPTAWALGACLAYTLAISSLALHLSVRRVPRRADPAPGCRLLWGWTIGAGAALLLLGAQAGCVWTAALAVGLGLVRAEIARRQPRTTAFRRLGWREAVWLGMVGALLAALAP